MIRIKVLVVLYNKLPKDSETILSLSNIKENIKDIVTLLVWDNSSIGLSKNQLDILDEALSPLKYVYRNNGKNTPLSIIYNSVINELDKNEILIIFDHDSLIDLSYFDALIEVIRKEPDINLFLPIIKYNNLIVSPANLRYFKGSYWQKEQYGLISSYQKTAINSGMAIRGSYLKSDFEGYNEEILFYGTDDDFMRKYSKQNKYFYVLNCKIDHVLNFFENTDVKDKIRRYKDMRRANLIMMKSEGIVIHALSYIYFFFCSAKLAIVNKNIRFLL